MDTKTCPFNGPTVPARPRSPARLASGLALTSLLAACGASDPAMPPGADARTSSAASAPGAPAQDRPGLNPVAAGTHLFDPVQGQPIPALTPPAAGSAPVPAPAPPGSAQALAAAATDAETATANGRSPERLSAGSAPSLNAAPAAEPGVRTIVVMPGLAVDRERAPNLRLDRSARP